MFHDLQPEPPLSEPRGEPIDACPVCDQKYLSNYVQWFDCESCERKVCQGCAIEKDGHTLCKECKDQPACPECGSYKHTIRTVEWMDGESLETDVVIECLKCHHLYDGDDQ